MQTLEILRENLAELINVAKLFPIITVTNAVKAVNLVNPMAGLTTTELRYLKKILQNYRESQEQITQIVFQIEVIHNTEPKLGPQKTQWLSSLETKAKALELNLNKLTDSHKAYEKLMTEIIHRVNAMSVEIYLKNFSQLDPKPVIDAFQKYQNATADYQHAISHCSMFLDDLAHHWPDNPEKEQDRQKFCKRLAEIRRLENEVIQAKEQYHTYLNQEARIFVMGLHSQKQRDKMIQRAKKTKVKSKQIDLRPKGSSKFKKLESIQETETTPFDLALVPG